MGAFARLFYELLASAVAPDRCASCDAAVPFLTAFCPPCAATLILAEIRDERHLAAFVYGGAVARAITRLKFERRPDIARPLSSALRRAAVGLGANPPEVVIPVPLHPRRLVERGYNQSALLSAPVAQSLGARHLALGLLRQRETAEQATLDRGARLVNVSKAFVVPRPSAVLGRSLLVVDDVRTTGATLAACAEALFGAGAREVRTLTVAQAELAQPGAEGARNTRPAKDRAIMGP